MSKRDELQEWAINKCLNFFKTNRFGLANLAMRFGKMKVAIEVLRRHFNHNPKVLICYPNNVLLDAWRDECVKWDYVNPTITYSNFSSLVKYKDEIFDFVIIDEPQNCSDGERDYCHQIITNSPKTLALALSGTITNHTRNEWGFKEIVKYTTLQGIDDEILANYEIYVHKVELDTKIKTPNSKGKLLSEKQKYDNLSFVINKQQEEGKDIMFLALTRNRLSTGSIAKLNYTKKLLSQIQGRCIVFTGLEKVANQLGIPVYSSKSKDNQNLKDFQEGKIDKLALVEAGKVGVTFPNLDYIIMTNVTSNSENTSQAINRAIQLDYSGKVAKIYLIVLNEKPELKKVQETLLLLDKNKIKYI